MTPFLDTPDDPMAVALASLPTIKPQLPKPRELETTQPYRTKKGALKYQPQRDWSLNRLSEVESEFKRRTGQALPVSVRGQGAIHNRWGYAHENSADIGLNPSSKEGQTLLTQLQEQEIPFLAFDRAIPGVATGPHIHVGRPSSRRSTRGAAPVTSYSPPQSSDDPMAKALESLGVDAAQLEQQQPQQRQPPAPSREITGADVFWHLGADPTELRGWKPKVRDSALRVVQKAVMEDERKRAEGQEIGETNLQYQNEMRRSAGLAPISGELNLSGRAQLARNLGPLRTGPTRRAITFDPDEEDRNRIRQEVTAERQARREGPMMQARAALALADEGQGSTAIESEVSQRLAAQRQAQKQHEQIVSQFTEADKGEIKDFIDAVKGSGEKTQGLRLAARTVGSDLLFKLAGASETQTLGLWQGKNYLADWLRRKATAGELSVEEVRKELSPSQQRDLAEFASSLPLGVVGVAPFVMAGGPIGGFAASGFTGALGRQKPAAEVLEDTAREATIGAVFKGAGRLEGPGKTLLSRAGQVAKSGVAIGAGTFGVEKAFGAENEEALKAAGTNVLLHSAMSAPRVIRGGGRLPAAVQASEKPPAQWQHRDFGLVTESANQAGVGRGKVRVVEESGQEHTILRANLAGAGNQIAVPVKERASQADRDPMAEALTSLGVKIQRAQEPDAGPFRGLSDEALYDLATRSIPKGTTRGKRQQIAQQQSAARVELERRQTETPIEIIPPDTGLRAQESDVPSFRDYVENRPQGGTRFETLEPGTRDFEQLAQEYADRYGTRAVPTQQATSPEVFREAQQTRIPSPTEQVAPLETRRAVEVAPLKQVGEKLQVGGAEAEVIDAQRLDGVDYELYKSGNAGAMRVYDSDSGNVVSLTKHPKFTDAAKAYSETVTASGGNAKALRDRLPANLLKEIPAKDSRPAKEELPPARTLSIGRESKAVTERGSEINTRYAVSELDDLITSHDSILNINPKFPPELQPRERDRAASAEQISRIATQLRPEFLGESPKASEGAPIIGNDGIVESGNGRVLAIRQAYESKNRGGQEYKRFLTENAERLGLDPQAITDSERPVLVRIRVSDVDRPQFVKEANEQSIASMSPVEQARSDSKMLKGALLDLFRPSDSGGINTTGNINFVRAFMRDVVGPNELGRYTTASGHLSQEGISRIRNAIFARAFGDSPEGLIALEKLAESPDNNVRNVTNAMLRNAAGFASLKEGIDQGTRYPIDLASDISAAMSKMASLRETGMLVPDYLKQGALYGDDLTPIQKRLLQVFDENKRGANTIDAILKNYLRGAEAAGSPAQAGFFGTETPSKVDFLEAAILEAIDAHQRISPDLFATRDQGLPSEPAARRGDSQINAEISRPISEMAEPGSPPRLSPESAPVEAAGRPLARFDSTIDRLKNHEQEARQRLAERGTEYQRLLGEKGSELGASTIPEDLYDFVVIGASKLAQRSLNVAQFVDEMVREFGEAIRKHARTIFTHSRKMVTETQKEIRNERLSKEIADRLFTENVPRDQQREALRIAARFRTSTDTQGRFLSGFKSRVAEMARSYGAAGGELTNRLHLGDIARGHEMEAGNKYLTKIQDVYGKTKNDFERQRISDAVINALENRAEADRYLDTAQKREVYEQTKAMLDEFRKKLTALGYETREDYFTHIRDVDVLDQIISDAKDPKDVNLNDLVAAKSRFLQTRTDAKMEIKRDLPRVLFSYLKSVTKEIAYGDAVEYYYDQFPTDIPISLRKNSMDRAIRLMQNSLKPEQGRGVFYRGIGRLRSEQYRNFLAYNLKASAQNFTQVEFARLRWTPEARSLSAKMWRNRKALTGPLADAIAIASTEQTPLMRFLEQFKGDEPSGSRNRFSEVFNKYDPFQASEKRNWALSEMGSIINSVVKRPEYKTLKAQIGAEAAISKMLEKQDVFDAAVREAATTAAETQVAANPAMRGEFYDAPLHRIIGMFTAFKTRQMQILGEALRSHEGVNGARAQTILRRGLSGDAQPVEVLREIEAQRRAMETMVTRVRKFNEDIGIPLRSLGTMVQHLKQQEAELNGIIKRLEPLSGGRAQSAALVAKYFAKVAAISVFFNLFWDSVYTAIAGKEKDEGTEERVSTALKRAFWDVLPTPFYGADPSRFLVSPVAPNFERSAPYGNITRRGVIRDIVSYGTSVVPFAGVVDRVSGRRLSGAAVDVIAPKKQKEKKIRF